MISKKSRKVVAALLIGATVCASGTFAYFNARTDLSKIDGVTDATQKTLNITNGKIEISGKISGVESGDIASLWGYDVARVSTLDAMTATISDGSGGTQVNPNYDADFVNLMNGAYSLTLGNGMAMSPNYISANKSPDILGLKNDVEKQAAINTAKQAMDQAKGVYDAAVAANGAESSQATTALADYNSKKNTYEATLGDVRSVDKRAEIGEAVAGAIVNARPGDAFALGGAGTPSGDIVTAGITIDNKSNLTTKIGIRINKEKTDEVKKQLDSMNANGWKVYIKVINPLSKPTANEGIAPYADWTEIKSDSFNPDDNFTCAVSTVKPGQAAPTIQMRVELPLKTENEYQGLSTGNNLSGAGGTNEFNIANMFEVVATQENNPGWNEDGSTDNPITASDTQTPAPYQP